MATASTWEPAACGRPPVGTCVTRPASTSANVSNVSSCASYPFVLLGVYQETGKDPTVVRPEQSGLMFIAWRCLYAEVVRSRIDERPIDLAAAYKRTIQVTITRLKAYEEKWKL